MISVGMKDQGFIRNRNEEFLELLHRLSPGYRFSGFVSEHKIPESEICEDIFSQVTGKIFRVLYAVTQSTVSRDLNYLRISKVRNYKQEEYYSLDSKYFRESIFNFDKLKSIFKESVISLAIANNIIVIKTYAGEAQGTASVIDGINFVEILGTVAGDDTIICIVDGNDNVEKIFKLIEKL